MSENQPVIKIDTTQLAKTMEDRFKSLEKTMIENLTPKAETKGLTEVKGVTSQKPYDYRPGVANILKSFRERLGPDDYEKRRNIEDIAIRTETPKGPLKETSYSLKESFVEAIGTISPTCCIPEVWADKIERDHVYPGSIFLGAWFMNWYDEIQGKPGDTVNICRVGPATCVDLSCDEPATTAAAVTCPQITLEHDACAYTICRADIEDVQVGLVDALNEGLGSCLAVCIDNYFFNVALSCNNRGTYTHTGRMTGSLIAEAMATVEAGTYEPAKLIMHPVPYKHLMQDSQFVNAATFGNRDVIATGRIVNYLGLEINETPKGTLVVGGGTYRSLMLAKGALAGAIKHGITIETEYSPRLQKRYVIADIRYGGVCLHPDGIYWVLSKEY